jgi:ketosteroid isomerase-like protein
MSAENLEFAREAVRAFNERDVDWVLAHTTPDVEWFPAIVGGVEGSSFRGHSGIQEMFKLMEEFWEQFNLEPEEIRDLGDGFLVLAQARASGKMGVQLEHSMDAVFGLRDGKMAKGRAYLDRDEALAAAEQLSGEAARE